jgi:site-specific DNA recombinase
VVIKNRTTYKETAMTRRAVTYARVSSNDREKTGGENLADQTRLCRNYALEHGYDVIADFAEDDRGASGAEFDLPELAKVLDLARNGGFDVLIVRELDRLSRDLAKQLSVEQELKRAGVAIEYVLYDFPDTPEGVLSKNIRAVIAEYEREEIKRRMTRGKLRKIRNGEAINHGHPLFGYRNTKKDGKAALEINEEEARTVRLIFQWYTKGDGERGPMSTQAIAKQLTQLHIPSYSDLRKKTDCTSKTVSEYGHWERSSVSSILSNATYTGTWHYGRKNWDEKDQILVAVPVIIDKETWAIAQHRRENGKRESKRNRKYNYLLAGRLICGECGRVMAGNPKHSYYKGEVSNLTLYYYCQAHRRGYPCEMRVNFRADHADEAAWDWVRGLLVNPDALQESLQQYQAQREELTAPSKARLEILNDLITKDQAKLERLYDLYLDEGISREDLAKRKSQLESELNEHREEHARLERQVQEQEFSEEQLLSVAEFAKVISAGVKEAEGDFNKRRELIEALNVTGRLAVENGAQVLYLHCVIGEDVRIVYNSSSGDRIPGRGSCCISTRTRYRAA